MAERLVLAKGGYCEWEEAGSFSNAVDKLKRDVENGWVDEGAEVIEVQVTRRARVKKTVQVVVDDLSTEGSNA